MSRSDQENCAYRKQPVSPNSSTQCRIRRLNDGFRKTLMGGQVNITSGVHAFGSEALKFIITAVQQYERFDLDNDPYGEHDFGSFTWGVHRLLWKIDYYDETLEFGSSDPADPHVTYRVLTIMLASEY